ncbi:MAG: NAD(P)/FAD-dependent oxidoreductase [Acidobacteriota bacterium]
MIVVIGGGVVGLAIARAFATESRDVCVLERHGRLGTETSTHNSGVIHAGLYYPPGSLKSSLCIEGREQLYRYCASANLPHVRCGKLIVGQADEEGELARIHKLATDAGASLEPVDAAFVAAREPHVKASAALWSPDTGWVEAEALIRALEAEIQRLDGIVLVGSPVIGIESASDGARVVTPHERIEVELVVNAAGLFADEVSAMAGGEAFTIYPCRGEYATLAPHARHLIRGLVYPVPHAAGHGLGTHFTRTIDGEVWLGPTVHYQDDKRDYEGGRAPVESFLEPARALVPSLTLADLRLGGSGIRPKLHPASERFADFMIRRDSKQPWLIHAAGIESPGLTACLAIGDMVAELAR